MSAFCCYVYIMNDLVRCVVENFCRPGGTGLYICYVLLLLLLLFSSSVYCRLKLRVLLTGKLLLFYMT